MDELDDNGYVAPDSLGALMDKVGGVIPANLGTPISEDEDDPINDPDEGAEAISRKADAELKAKEAAAKAAAAKGGKGGQSDKEKEKEIADLTAKAEKDIDSLTDEEVDKLVKAGVLTDSSKAESDDAKKAKELSAKSEDELTDEEKEFLTNYNEKANNIVDKVKQALVGDNQDIKLDKTYTNDGQGIVDLTNDVVEAKAALKFNEFIKSDPSIEKLYKHFVIEKRGLETFLRSNSKPDHKAIKLEKESESNDEAKNNQIIENQRAMVSMLLQKRGVGADEIKVLLDNYEDSKKLYDKAVEASKTLDKEDSAEKQAMLDAEQAAIEQENKARQAAINKVKEVVGKNDFGGFKIPKEDLQPFLKALVEPINDEGLTRMDVLRNQRLSIEREVLIDYLLYKDMKVPGISNLSKQARTLAFVKGKKGATRNPLRGAGDGGETIVKPAFNLSDINFGGIKFAE